MNKWNQLLAALDAVYGFENRLNSTFRKRQQWFDERSNEHVVVIEYRVRKGVGPVQQKPVQRAKPAQQPKKKKKVKGKESMLRKLLQGG